MKMKTLATVAMMCIATSGCSNMSQTEKGVAIGAAAGGVFGQMVSHNKTGTMIGAVIGSVIGGAIGSHLDSVAKEAEENLKLNEKGENIDKTIAMKKTDDTLAFRLDDSFMFEKNKSELSIEAKQRLSEIGASLAKIDDGSYIIFVTGNTDATGGLKINLPLSRDRALVVSEYLKSFISKTLIDSRGFASSIPMKGIDKNDFRNRRTEIQIIKLDSKYQEAIAKRQKVEQQLENLLSNERPQKTNNQGNNKKTTKLPTKNVLPTPEPEIAFAKIDLGDDKYSPKF